MPEDYYGSEDSTPTQGDQGGEGGGEDKPHDTGKTAVVPSELCPGMKVGDEMVVKILSVDDDSYEIGYAPKEKGEKEEGGDEPAEEPAPKEGSMASMY